MDKNISAKTKKINCLSTVQRVNDELKQDRELRGKHIGLQNVNQRIRLIFGADYGITIQSDGQTGTTITVWLPKAN